MLFNVFHVINKALAELYQSDDELLQQTTGVSRVRAYTKMLLADSFGHFRALFGLAMWCFLNKPGAPPQLNAKS